MKARILAGMVLLAAGGAVVLGTLGGETKPPVGETKPVLDDTMRAIKIDGACPTGTTQEAAKCEGGSWQDSKGGCLCLTKQKAGTVDGEVSKSDDLAPAKQNVLLVCPAKDGKGQPSVRWTDGRETPPAGCVVAAKSMVDVSIGDLSTDLVEQLRTACAPCPVTGSSWGACPRCLLTEGGCAQACK